MTSVDMFHYEDFLDLVFVRSHAVHGSIDTNVAVCLANMRNAYNIYFYKVQTSV